MADDKLKTGPEPPGPDRPGDAPAKEAPPIQEPPVQETDAPGKTQEPAAPGTGPALQAEQSVIPGMGEDNPARSALGEVVVDFDKINELIPGGAAPGAPAAPGRHLWTKCPEVRGRRKGGKRIMKRFRVMAAALCAAVLLCGFSVPAYAYADGGEGADYGDPTMTEETSAPEPTIEPGEGFSEEGNLVTRDLLYDEHTNKQFITVQTSGGNTFYIVIDYDKPVDEEGEQYETYFFSVVDEADLLAAAEAAGVEQAVCSCSEKCEAGAVNTDCAVCSVNMSKCVGVEPEPEPTATEEPAPEEAEPETGGNMGMLLAVLAVALVGGGAAFYFKVLRPKQQKAAAPQDDYGDELTDYDEPDGYGDEDDDGPPWDEDDDDGEEEDK